MRRAIRDVHARLVLLPKYSPDLNPIEQVFAKLKTCCERSEPEATKPSPKPVLRISPNTRPEECAAYIRNAGYA